MALAAILPAVGAAAAAANEDAGVAMITREDCRRLVRLTDDQDVAYRPGIDVHGRPVAPADLDGQGGLQLPTTFAIPITVDVLQGFGPAGPHAPLVGDAVLGTLLVDGDELYFNGRPIEPTGRAFVERACRRLLAR